MQTIKSLEIKCPHCQKITFRFGADISGKDKFVCPICGSDLLAMTIKPAIDALVKYNSASTFFKENRVKLIEHDESFNYD